MPTSSVSPDGITITLTADEAAALLSFIPNPAERSGLEAVSEDEMSPGERAHLHEHNVSVVLHRVLGDFVIASEPRLGANVHRERAIKILWPLVDSENMAGRHTAGSKLMDLCYAIEDTENGVEYGGNEIPSARVALARLGRQTRALVPQEVIDFVGTLTDRPPYANTGPCGTGFE
jgi:hypothetical protein